MPDFYKYNEGNNIGKITVAINYALDKDEYIKTKIIDIKELSEKEYDIIEVKKLIMFYNKYFLPLKESILIDNYNQWYNTIKKSYEAAQEFYIKKKSFQENTSLFYICLDCVKNMRNVIFFITNVLGDANLQNQCKIDKLIADRNKEQTAMKKTNSNYSLLKQKLEKEEIPKSKKFKASSKCIISPQQIGILTKKCLEIFSLSRATIIIGGIIGDLKNRSYIEHTDITPSIITNEQIGLITKFCVSEDFSNELIGKILYYVVVQW